MSKWWKPVAAAAAAVGIAVGVPVACAPRAVRHYPDGVDSLEDAAAACRASGKAGWELVAYAQNLVARKFAYFSVWHLWEGSQRAFGNSRGNARRYNAALHLLLDELGFRVQPVHAARVRRASRPWWSAGHSWLQVEHGGTMRDVCAGSVENRPGKVDFEPLTRVRPVRPWTHTGIEAALSVFVVGAVWRALLLRRPAPRWVYHPRPVDDD